MDEAFSGECEHAVAQPSVHEIRRGDLNQRAVVDEPTQLREEIGSEVPLGVRDQRPETPLAQIADSSRKRLVERTGRRLEQDPPAAAAERHRAQLSLIEAVQRGRRDLASRKDPGPTAGGGDRARELLEPLGKLRDAHVVIVADVGRGADRADPVGLRDPRHLDRVGQIPCPVIDAGQDVAVQVYGGENGHVATP